MTNGKLKIAITGMGAICGLGHDLPEIWKRSKRVPLASQKWNSVEQTKTSLLILQVK